MSIILFCQNIGAAVSLPAANAVFSNSLRSELAQRLDLIGVEANLLVDVGVRSIRTLISGDQLTATLQAYSEAIDAVMYLGIAVSIAVSIAAFAFGWGLGLKDIRREKKLLELRSEDRQVEW